MYLRRAGRLPAAVLDRAIRSTGSVLAQRDGSLTLRKDHTFLGPRCFCVSGPVRVGPVTHEPASEPRRGWDSDWDWGHFHRVAALSAHLSAQMKAGSSDVIKQPHAGAIRGVSVGSGLLTGNRGPCGPHLSTGIMQTRSSSTKKSDSGGQQTSHADKGEEQSLKPASTPAATEPEPGGEKPSKNQQLKKVFKEYGAVGISFHICTALMSLGMFYLLTSSGIDMAAVLCKVGFSEAVVRSKMAAGTSTFVLAYAVHKLFAPVRISITLVSVPLIVRYFRKTGLFKPPTPAP